MQFFGYRLFDHDFTHGRCLFQKRDCGNAHMRPYGGIGVPRCIDKAARHPNLAARNSVPRPKNSL